MDDTCEQFQKCRLTGSIGPYEAHDFTGLDAQRDLFECMLSLPMAIEEPLNGSFESGRLFVDAKGFGEIADFDHAADATGFWSAFQQIIDRREMKPGLSTAEIV